MQCNIILLLIDATKRRTHADTYYTLHKYPHKSGNPDSSTSIVETHKRILRKTLPNGGPEHLAAISSKLARLAITRLLLVYYWCITRINRIN